MEMFYQGCRVGFPIISQPIYFPTGCFQLSLSSPHSSWDQQLQQAHGRERVLVQMKKPLVILTGLAVHARASLGQANPPAAGLPSRSFGSQCSKAPVC